MALIFDVVIGPPRTHKILNSNRPREKCILISMLKGFTALFIKL